LIDSEELDTNVVASRVGPDGQAAHGTLAVEGIVRIPH